MKDFLITLLKAGIPFGITMGLVYGVLNGVYAGVFGGALTGLLFGIILSAFVLFQSKKFRKRNSEIANGKEIIMEGVANHFIGKEAVGGWLLLTPSEVIFKSHSFNIQKHQTIIQLKQISHLRAVPTLRLVPNGLEITTTFGNREKFVVNNRKTWIQKINEAITKGI